MSLRVHRMRTLKETIPITIPCVSLDFMNRRIALRHALACIMQYKIFIVTWIKINATKEEILCEGPVKQEAISSFNS